MAQITGRRAALTAAAAAIIVVGISGCTGEGVIPDVLPADLDATEGTLTISAPIRNEGASNVIYSDSILITLSKSLAEDDIDCDLEYAVPTLQGAAGTFSTTVTPGE